MYTVRAGVNTGIKATGHAWTTAMKLNLFNFLRSTSCKVAVGLVKTKLDLSNET